MPKKNVTHAGSENSHDKMNGPIKSNQDTLRILQIVTLVR